MIIVKAGTVLPFALIAMPFVLIILFLIISNPRNGVIACMIVAFVVNGIGRYISAPFGLLLDVVLVLTLVAAVFYISSSEWVRIKNPVTLLIFVWFLFTLFEIFNPEANSFEAWFYAVRGIALYMMMIVSLVFLVFHKEKDYDLMIRFWFVAAVVSALYGMKQLYFGVNSAEQAWLDGGGSETHILFGRLRVFSFFSDAGQFGAFMGYTAVVATILALGNFNFKKKAFYIITALICYHGMSISGTRGALFVPLIGLMSYLFLSKKFSVLFFGLKVLGCIFFVLKFTYLGQGNYQVQRMRSALDPNDPSLQVRLENQKKYKEYLHSRPFGGGIGTAGYWGQRFSPGTFLAETPTDSHYVRIWAETGIVGLLIHVSMLVSIFVICFYKIYKITDPKLKQKLMAIFAGCFGIAVASYGNQVIGQMPTNVFFCISLSFLYLGSEWETPASIVPVK
jgi:hypothetical protein